jgi:hypothetical protein
MTHNSGGNWCDKPEIRGSNPFGSTLEIRDLQVKRERPIEGLELILGLVVQPIL